MVICGNINTFLWSFWRALLSRKYWLVFGEFSKNTIYFPGYRIEDMLSKNLQTDLIISVCLSVIESLKLHTQQVFY